MIFEKRQNRRIIERSFPKKKSARYFLAGSLAAIAMLGLAACGGTATPTAQPTATIPAAQSAPTDVSPTGTAVVSQEAPATVQPADAPDATMDMSPTAGSEAAAPTAVIVNAEPTATTVSGSTGDTADSTTTAVQATLREWAIDLSQSEVPAGKITFTVTNTGQMMHNLTVEGDSGVIAQTPTFSGRQGPQTLEVNLQPGTYTLICSLPGHAQRGQKTTLVVK